MKNEKAFISALRFSDQSASGWRRVGKRMAYLSNGNFLFGRQAMDQAAKDKQAIDDSKMKAQPQHVAPEGVPTIQDSIDVTRRRIESGYVIFPPMEPIESEEQIIRCATCPWYRKDDAFCFHPENQYQCNGLIGCCDYWKNSEAQMWLNGDELEPPVEGFPIEKYPLHK